jgi:hypothetical protein
MCYGCQSPVDELLSLRAYGRILSRKYGPSFRVHWSDDSETVTWGGGKLKIDQLRRLGSKAIESETNSLTRLMRGLKPTLQLENVRDRLSNYTQDYSFVHDSANKLDSGYLDLSSRACLDQTDGLMSSDRWNMAAVNRYLDEERELLIQFMLILYLRGGQAPRSTELFSIMHQSSSIDSRGLCVHNGSMIYIIRHWKARHSTNREFQVVHYLPRVDSQLLATYLAHVPPFTDMLYRTCVDRTYDRRLFFTSPESKGKPWNCSIPTKTLKELTRHVCGVAFGVQIYRQLSIAVTERHIKQVSKPFNRYDDKSREADIEVAFAWQSGHRPLQRGMTYGIDAAYPDSLQPALLSVYEWASKEWHGFINADGLSPITSRTAAGLLRTVEIRDRSHSLNSKRPASTTLTERDSQRQSAF